MKKGPSEWWVRQFLERHSLSNRTAESISAARAKMSTLDVVNEFFDLYLKTIEESGLQDKPSQVNISDCYGRVLGSMRKADFL